MTAKVGKMSTQRGLLLSIAIFLLWMKLPDQSAHATVQTEIMEKWGDNFGEELWDLAQTMTKASEITAKYKAYNARVEHKDGESLITSIVENVGRMFIRKMDAIKCIISLAEELSEQFEFNETIADNFTYYSSKYSNIDNRPEPDIPSTLLENIWMYRNMSLNPDTHFFNISVNTSYSSVHVPQNVYDRYPWVLEALQWSEALDDVFVQNYNSDPALSWQYFGSSTGMLRHYPALEWDREQVDTFDCRKRSWYIETATCSKDIVILLDNSGSMTGYRNYIAQLTVKSVLDTFSNNDFINIYKYSNDVDPLVPCFSDILVQATPENIRFLNEYVKELQPEGYANVGKAFVKAFELLQNYREIRRCNESISGCNQAIMLITDGVPSNITEVFEQYNWFENGTKIPVRVFTYLLGREVTKVREIQWMACLNRGHYSHIQSLDEVQEEVLKYVTVIATPLVLQGVEHPPTWTHAFTDTAENLESEADDDEPPRLMIAVGAPAFDRKANHYNETRTARLLGVAGTDIPVEDLDELTLPYKLGVNGYSFIVSNNGYVLMHPDLRPVSHGRLKENYNSIDLTEIEQILSDIADIADDSLTGREMNKVMEDLREQLVFSKVGKMLKVPVRFHYDKMRRVSLEYQDYYFAPLENTPFSLGLVLPHDYGNTWIKVGDEIKRNQHMGTNISEFFVGENWKVHPEWVYCKYHYLEGHEFKTPEDELQHFLVRLYEPNWKWSQQYEPEPEDIQRDANCGRKTLDDDAYYCNKELVQLLVFDAKVTNNSYRSWEFQNDRERKIIEMYNATLRFVATMSGLTRWQFIFGEVEVESDNEFGDYHKMSIDETWYKSAILQHKVDPKSFVYSVPHASDEPEDVELKVTASMGIFPRDGGLEAPGCVTGFQFSHELMQQRFMEITSKTTCDGCIETCHSETRDCYVIDNNGYVVLSESSNDTGRFFGEVEGAILKSMVEKELFAIIPVFDLQGLCLEERVMPNDAFSLMHPLKVLLLGINWLIAEFFITLSKFDFWVHGIPSPEYYDAEDYDESDYSDLTRPKKPKKIVVNEEEEYFNRPKEIRTETVYNACDKKSELYVMQQDKFIKGDGFIYESLPSNPAELLHRPYFAKRIPRSNLLMIIVENEYPSDHVVLSAAPQDINYNVSEGLPCVKTRLNFLPRRRLEECYTEHPDEELVAQCGGTSKPLLQLTVVITSLVSLLLYRCAQKLVQF
ncbi:voltage-dependent calcium channel subunit alpha-2/delta-3 isoform X2 [Culex quinquefasciatus]|uniref:voltage-dependent calcium channel subunit alpha-2/delta-3 isoform X2 n=1 Tax=Culex quinquefasciatus TaxID=7176 RepID=UPI0018E35E2E|nr:voltage-dependent calcium channel subunit alpha-2/delta-3 isoform X2 [Culex quinquefasciatus]XP_039443478.1 voltage-dependent calcium channel subunit alpha-2/delta-3 isoform X2 [Culex pipiens pallens]